MTTTEPTPIYNRPPEVAEDLVWAGIEAFRLTREYVGEEVLPAVVGWSWYDWCQRATRWLADHEPDRARVLRVAQKGWNRTVAARTLDEVHAGIGCLWIEYGGIRTDHVVAVDVRFDEGFCAPVATIELIGGIEVVYVGADGEELGICREHVLPAEDVQDRYAADTIREPADRIDVTDLRVQAAEWRRRALIAERAVDQIADLALPDRSTDEPFVNLQICDIAHGAISARHYRPGDGMGSGPITPPDRLPDPADDWGPA